MSTDPLIIRIAAPPIDGRANEELISFLSKTLKITQSSINIVHGANIKQKILEIENLSLLEIQNKLKEAQGRLL